MIDEFQDVTQQIEELMNKREKMLIKAKKEKQKVNDKFILGK